MTTSGPKSRLLLNQRDRALLTALAGWSYAPLPLIFETFFTPIQVSKHGYARLSQLEQAGLIYRLPPECCPFLASRIVSITPTGAALISPADWALPSGICVVPRKDRLPAGLWLHHHLSTLELAQRFVRSAPPCYEISFFAEPHVRIPATKQARRLWPDGMLIIADRKSGLKACFYLENEQNQAHVSYWVGKVQRFQHLSESGQFRELYQRPNFRVLVITPAERLASQLQAATAQHYQGKLFFFTSEAQLQNSSPFDAIWTIAGSTVPQTFLEGGRPAYEHNHDP